MPVLEVDYTESSMAERSTRKVLDTVIVRTAMSQGRHHGGENREPCGVL